MSDHHIHEDQHETHPGFNSVLLINLDNDIVPSTIPHTDLLDSVANLNLSFESSTNEEKFKSDSRFVSCLSKDLLNMLEEDTIPSSFEDGENTELQSKVASEVTHVQNEKAKNEDITADEKNAEIRESNAKAITEANYTEINIKEQGEEKKDFEDCFNCKGNSLDYYSQQQGAFCFQAFCYWQRIIQQYSANNTSAKIPYNKPGWTCQTCKNYNYEIRIKCNRCGQPKYDEYNRSLNGKHPNSESSSTQLANDSKPVNLSPTTVSNANGSTVVESKKKKKPFVERAGDWNCFKCKNLNFSFRTICNRCQMQKKESEKSYEEYTKNALTYFKINEIIQNKQFHDYNVNKSKASDELNNISEPCDLMR